MLIKIAFRNIWRNKRRTAFCLASVGLSVFFFVIFQSMQDGILRSMNNTAQVFETGHISVVSAQYESEKELMPVQYPIADGKNWQDIAANIYEIQGVKAIFPRIVTMATLQENRVKHATLLGIDIKSETAFNHFNFANRNDGLVEGRWPENANECAIGVAFAEKSNLIIGDSIPLRTTSAEFSDRMWSPTITGIYNFDFLKYDDRFIIADFNRVQRLLTLGNGTQQLNIFIDDENRSPIVASELKRLLGNDSVVTEWNDNYWIASQKIKDVVFLLVFLIALILSSFLIINTMVMIIHERIKEIGVMGCLGLTRIEIVKVFFFESIILAAIGALCGAIIGGIITGILAKFPLRLGDMYGNSLSEAPISNTIFFLFSIKRIMTAWIIGVIGASLFTIIPSLKSAFIEPVEALRR